MLRPASFALLVVTLAACQSKQQDQNRTAKQPSAAASAPMVQTSPNDAPASQAARQWLIRAVARYAQDSATMEELSTAAYARYKQDATNVDMNEGLTAEAFAQKWRGQYDTRHAGTGVGFLIGGQDWGKITVPTCRLKSAAPDSSAYVFATTIRDKEFKQEYQRDIKVVRTAQGFLIADVLEYN